MSPRPAVAASRWGTLKNTVKLLIFNNKTGGGDRNRTRDILLAKQALYQLSYAPTFRILKYKFTRETGDRN